MHVNGVGYGRNQTESKKLQSLFLKPLIVENHEVNIAMSIGINMYSTDGDTIESLLKKADHTIYTSKSNGEKRDFLFSRVRRLKPHDTMCLLEVD